jgi:hypothetical protein
LQVSRLMGAESRGGSKGGLSSLHAQVEHLLGAQGDLRGQLRDAEEELEAARRVNRRLIGERNSGAIELRP